MISNTEESKEFLKTLLNTCSPSGYEMEMANIYCNYMRQFCEVKTDIMCNSIAVINPNSDYRILVDAHCDEIGMQVIHIDNNGYIYFRRSGGIDPGILEGAEVVILGKGGLMEGIIGKKPVHIQKPEEYKHIPDIDELWIDLGIESIEEIKRTVSIGDYITFKPNMTFHGATRIKSKGLDNKIGVYILTQVMRLLSSKKLGIGVYGLASSQEEIGGRGAIVQSFNIKPDLAFVVDAGFATDVPNISVKNICEMKLGAGVGICHSADNNILLVNVLRDIAADNNIPYQDNVPIAASGGNNTCRIQLIRNGVATALLSIPNRYMHTPVEICDLRDIESCIDLLVATILYIDKNKPINFIPYMNSY